MALTPMPPSGWDGSPHTPATTDTAEIIGHLRTIFNAFVVEINDLHAKMKADGDDPHSHFAYRMVEWGECKQLDEALFGTYNSSGVKQTYGIYDIILNYDTAANACTLSFDISAADSTSTPIPQQAKVKGATIKLPNQTGLVAKGGESLGGWYVRAVDYYGPDDPSKPPFHRDLLIPFGGDFVVPSDKNSITIRLNTTATLSQITFDLNGGTGTEPDSLIARTGDLITIPGANNIVAPTGKYFVGWATTSTATVFEFAPNSEVQYSGMYNKLYAVYYTMTT